MLSLFSYPLTNACVYSWKVTCILQYLNLVMKRQRFIANKILVIVNIPTSKLLEPCHKGIDLFRWSLSYKKKVYDHQCRCVYGNHNIFFRVHFNVMWSIESKVWILDGIKLTWLSFFQRLSVGPSSVAQISLSNLLALASALCRTLSWPMTWLLIILCADLSMFSGKPKYEGLSNSGSSSIASM